MAASYSVRTRSPEETRIVAASLAAVILPGDVLSLSGDLGAGKTVFVQGLASALGVEDRVTSPTFTIHHQYTGRYPIAHVDVYRLRSYQEVLDLGLDELQGAAILVVEWGDAIAPLLPRRRLEVASRTLEGDDRQITFRPGSGDWVHKVESVEATATALLDAASGVGGAPPQDGESAPARDDMRAQGEKDEPEEKGKEA